MMHHFTVEAEWPCAESRSFKYQAVLFSDKSAVRAFEEANAYAKTFTETLLKFHPEVTIVLTNMESGKSLTSQVLASQE